jgi:acetyl-CoA C-acetyltransferase
MRMEPIYIVAGVRTAIGDFGGSLKDHSPADLGAIVIAEAVRRAGLAPEDVERAPALTLNRLCGSGLQAIISAAQMIALSEVGIAVAGGAEVMSRAPHHVTAARFGKKLGDMTMIDALTTVLSDPLDDYHMGITAENIARDCGVTREDQDALAAESHRRAARAQAEGRFDDQIVAVPVRAGRGTRNFTVDEHVRADANEAAMATLRPAFQQDGTVTAGNASGINDGGAAVVLASKAEVEARGLKPLGRILGWGHAGVAPTHMGLGPVEAVPIALARAGMSLKEIDVIESNEAFAAQACAVSRTLGFDPDKVNPNGSGISLGHPVGATGAILTVKALYELSRSGGRFALVTMCIGGGQGIAMVLSEV